MNLCLRLMPSIEAGVAIGMDVKTDWQCHAKRIGMKADRDGGTVFFFGGGYGIVQYVRLHFFHGEGRG